MGRFGARIAGARAASIGGDSFARGVGSCGFGVSRFECAGEHLRGGNCTVALDVGAGDELDGDRATRTSLDAGWSFAGSEASMAHVAFADDAALRGIFRNVVGTFENTILAADALIIEMTDDAGVWIFFVGENGAAIETGWIDAMMAGSGDDLLIRFSFGSADEQADAAPGFIIVEAVEGVTGANAGFATGAVVEVDSEGVLFSRAGRMERDEVAIVAGLGWRVGGRVMTGETFNGGELLLLGEQMVDESTRWDRSRWSRNR